MKIEKMVSVLQKFDEGDITQEKALEELKDAEPFDFYAATLELYLKGSGLRKGDSPRISKLFKERYKEDFQQLIDDLKDNHPIKRLMTEHVYFERLLGELEDINQEIKEESDKSRVVKIEAIANALNHLKEHIHKEERLIFPKWYDQKGVGDILLLEEEHEDILKSHKNLTKKSQERREGWGEKDWKDLNEKIDELIGELRFHTFHEGDLFYPIVTNEFDDKKFKEIKKKMDKIEEKNPDPTLPEHLSYLDLPVLRKK
ncbi:MAG: hemerythrin domain-containing protein [Candidatus Thermoplasmatota archaeon]|nr:hemerythrin domain-containing protein [Candidatus Thermoplasmatota archaeon]